MAGWRAPEGALDTCELTWSIDGPLRRSAAVRPEILPRSRLAGLPTFSPTATTCADALGYRFRYREQEGIEVGYVVEGQGRWYAVGYEVLHPMTGADRRRWHRAADDASARALAETLPALPRRIRRTGSPWRGS